jgi:hypothetical protein
MNPSNMVEVRKLDKGDVIEHDGKRLVLQGYGTRHGSKLWQLLLTHEEVGGAFLMHRFPADKVLLVKEAAP